MIKTRNRKRQTHCRRGHELTPDNLYYSQIGTRLKRSCKLCKNTNDKKRTKEAYKDYYDRTKDTSRAKQRARNAVNYAVRTGKIVKPKNCSWCNDEGRIEGHHDDYSKPLEVIWFCSSCHKARHFNTSQSGLKLERQ